MLTTSDPALGSDMASAPTCSPAGGRPAGWAQVGAQNGSAQPRHRQAAGQAGTRQQPGMRDPASLRLLDLTSKPTRLVCLAATKNTLGTPTRQQLGQVLGQLLPAGVAHQLVDAQVGVRAIRQCHCGAGLECRGAVHCAAGQAYTSAIQTSEAQPDRPPEVLPHVHPAAVRT